MVADTIRWLVVFDDTPEMLDVRRRLQDEHFAFLREHISEIPLAGGCRDEPGGDFNGGAWILEVSSKERAIELIENDPYFKANARHYRLRTWGKAFADHVARL